VGGVGKEFQVQGRNYPPLRKPKPLEEAGAWRIEVSPSTARTQDEFLHLLHIAERGTSPPPSPQPIAAGALKGCETQGLAILFAVKLRSVKSAAYTLSGPRRNLVFGLTPGQSIDFHLDGRRIAILKSSPAGSLDFENPTAGRIELTVK
jgi:hypothetical protein